MSRLLAGLVLVAGLARDASASPSDAGLLFYLSGEHGLTADFAANGKPEPNFASDVETIPDGARGAGIRCFNLQRLSYWAAGNVYAQRGTLAFFWRSRDPVGPTEFPVFRIGYADHSSWDMAWLRIDYNGHGFDAFVTDASLARVRVSYAMPAFPKPEAWVHLAFTWDETSGVRLFVNGRLAAAKEGRERLDAALDQFGPHSRIIGPWQVQSDYNFIRGGDIDEVRIYDHALPDAAISSLASGAGAPAVASAQWRNMNDAGVREEWWLRYGFDQPANPPPTLPVPAASVRKVEIHDAYDLKRWWWKANDGIRETTWPGVYNRSRLAGRNDYFQLPDWDCYSVSGRAITFTLPDEPWNHIEFSGAAWGRMTTGALTIERPAGHERTTHRLASPLRGGKLRFENAEAETPIGELSVYSVAAGHEPEGATKRAYRLASAPPSGPENEALVAWIAGRHPADERATLVARPLDAPAASAPAGPRALPLVHVLIPNDAADLGLDGIAIDIPALRVKPTHGDLFPLDVQVKDPLWPLRDMLDFDFSVKPGVAQTLWLDLRDRILPPGKGLYLTIAGAGADFGADSLAGAELRLVFKPREAARAEHVADRFTQARDSYAMLVEEHPRSPKLNLWVRFDADLRDLLRVDPDHVLGRQYLAAANPGTARLPHQQPVAPSGLPLWAFRQVELLERAKSFVTWYVDHRQIENGEMGGGLSDDTDLTNMWPGVALMGAAPDKLLASLRRVLDACYANGMFTHGLPTIQADELHSYEEGINALGQNLILDYGNPRQLERAMETTRGVLGLTGINGAGHRHFRSSYFSGTKVAEDGPWGWSKPYSYLVLQPAQLLADYNGNPDVRQKLVELADGLLAHNVPRPGGRRTPGVAIHFATDAEADSTRPYFPWPLYWTAWRFTGERRFLSPLNGNPALLLNVNANALDELGLRKEWKASGGAEHVDWQLTGDKRILERLYAGQIERADQLEYINTEGSLWIDRVGLPTGELQRARLGGIALVRNATFPGHAVSWRFQAPATERSLGILIPDATPTGMKIVAYNLDPAPVRATLTGWNVAPGRWRITQGVDANGDDEADAPTSSRLETFERSESIDVTFPPRVTSVIQLALETPGVSYWERPDLGIGREDVRVREGAVDVVVHSLGSVPSPATTLSVVDASGRAIASTPVAPLAAPLDLVPKTQTLSLSLPASATAAPMRIVVDPNRVLTEITKRNNVVDLPASRWVLDRTADVGGIATEVIGKPSVAMLDGLQAVRFDGAHDGLVVPTVPIAGRATFTIEAQIRPDAGGPPEQRFLHIEDAGGSRALLETRMVGDGRWALDSFLLSGEHRLALLDRARSHPSGGWHWVALRYDGKMMSHFVDGTLELSGPVEFTPMLDEGRTSLGVRLNRIYWYAGAIRELRFHEEALPPEKLQR